MTPLQWKNIGVVAVTLSLFTSCMNTAHIEKDESVNLGNYKTYSWVENGNSASVKNTVKKTTPNHGIAEQNVKSSVNQELKKNGFTEVKKNPDLLLSYDLLIEKDVKQQSDPVYSQPYSRVYYNPYTRRYGSIYYPSQFLGYDDYSLPVKEGTISISMIDPKTDKTVWQGWSTNELNANYISSKEIQKNVKSIFKKFDVK